jgi:O-antigen/teichoic acid export membrane protein
VNFKVKPLSQNDIRVRYSGFIIFASQIITLFTGLVFTLLLTRNMNTGEFGVWSFLSYLTGLFGLVNGLFPFWVTRFVAGGKLVLSKLRLQLTFFCLWLR